MSSRSILRSAARRLSFGLAFTALILVAACTTAPTDPSGDGTAGTLEPRLDGGDTTGTRWCDHTQTWAC